MTEVDHSVVRLNWEKKINLQEAFMREAGRGGIYIWGFKDHKGDVLWYVGKSTKKKGIYSRLRKHYLDIMSGQYQIPRGFPNGGVFETDQCYQSAWALEHRNPSIEATLQDWEKMQPILRAGHLFANNAIARVVPLDIPDAEIAKVERRVIHLLNPVINRQRGRPDTEVEMIPHKEDADWIDQWLQRRAAS